MLCNALIHPHFNYACPAWYPNPIVKHKKALQIIQNKYICFCLKLQKMHHISKGDFKTINWFPVDQHAAEKFFIYWSLSLEQIAKFNEKKH